MRAFTITVVLVVCGHVSSEIEESIILNKLSNIKPVGKMLSSRFIPLTELPPPRVPHVHMPSGRRHLDPDCTEKPWAHDAYEGPKAEIFGEYYDDRVAKTVATIIIPDHIDRKHFEITTQMPYLTVGTIEAIGYHPSTIKSDHPSECEKIYQDHMDDQYTDEEMDYSEESLEMARMPLVQAGKSLEERLYSDMVNK